jgi:F-type H+-transporting ATPase subunit c
LAGPSLSKNIDPPARQVSNDSKKEEVLVKNIKLLFLVAMIILTATTVFAQTATTTTTGGPVAPVRWDMVAAAIALGIAASAGAIGQSRAISAACEGIARNPGAAAVIRTVMIIGLALIESLVIYALVVALILVFK